MKRLSITFLCLIFVFWFMPMFVKAYAAPNGLDYEYKYTVSWYETRYYDLYSNIPFGIYSVNPNRYGQYNIGVVYNDSLYVDCDISLSNYNLISTGYKKYPNQESTNVILPESVAYICNQNGTVPTNSDNLWATTTNMPISGSTYEQLYTNLYNELNAVDYDTLYYSPLIPKVDFSVVLDSPSSVGSVSSEQNLFNVNINSDVGTDYYIQIGYKTHIPYKILVGVNSNGSPYYTNQLYGNSVSIENIYSLEDNQVAFSGNLNSDLFAWDRVAVSDSNFEFIDSLAGQTEFQTNAKNLYNNRMSYLMPLYGKKIEIFMRYFVIQDGVVIVGQWTHWNNTYPNQYTENLPDNYMIYHAIPGYQQNSDNVNFEDGENTIQNVGMPTGNTGNNIVINNNVPNYPNYPTVADYNRDNLLVGFINTAKSMPQYLGEFNDFLKLAFSFIDPSVWAVISLGFGASIVIMIIKVL